MGLLARARFFATQLYIAAALWLPLCSSVSPLVHTLVASGPLGSDTPLSSGFSFFRAFVHLDMCMDMCGVWCCSLVLECSLVNIVSYSNFHAMFDAPRPGTQ